jgi:hypothetical protein
MTIRKFVAFAAASAVLGGIALSAGPAAAQNAIVQGWRYNNNPAWADQQPYLGENSGGYGAPAYAPGYGPGYNNGYAYGYGDPDVASGAVTVPVCPDGYSLGRTGRLCWPD